MIRWNPSTKQYVVIAAETINGIKMIRILGNSKIKMEAKELVGRAREEARFGKGTCEIRIG